MQPDQNKSRAELIDELQGLRKEKAQLERERTNASRKDECFRELFQKAPAGYQVLDEHGYLLEVNNTWQEMLGYERHKVLGEHFSELLAGESRARFRKDLARLKANGGISGREYRMVCRDGSHIPISVNARISPNGRRKLRQIHCVLLDVSGQAGLLERLRAKERFLNAVLESIQDGISIIDTSLNICRMNDVMRQWAQTAGDPVGRKCYEAYRGASRPCSPCCALRSLQSGRTEYDEFAGPPGSAAEWIEVASHPMKCPETGQVEYVVEFVRDITRQKKSEKRLRYQKQLLETIIDEMEDVLAIQYPDLTLERYNQAGYAMFGISPEELDGKKCFQLLGRDEDCRICAPREVLKTKEPSRKEKYVPELGVHLDCRSSPVLDEDGKIVRIVNHLRDVSARKDFEARLWAERDYMFRIFNNMSQYIVVESPEHRTEFMNRAAREKFGNLMGTICYEQLNRTDPCPQCPMERVLTQELPCLPLQYSFEAFGMIMEGSASKLVNRDGSVSVLKVLDDVTDREQAKKALIQSESYYRAIFETSGAATVILEEDTTIALANSRFEELTEYSREEMEGVKPWTDFVHPDDVAWMKENHYLRRRDPEKAPNRYEFRLIDRGGEEHTIFLSVGLITGKRQSVASCIDISDHKKAEEALRRSEKYYRAVFETSGSAMFILEENTTISLVNSNFEKLCGYSRLEVEGRKSWFDFVHPEDVHWMKKYHTMRRVDSCSAPQQYEFRYFDRAWNERNGFLTVDVIPDTSESVISFIDITERKAMEEKLKEMSLFDPLTGLYNRAFFEEEMKRLADERHGPLSIIVCDINGLKLVNDTMGHNKGDELVKDTARLLKRCFRSSDITSRIGGDEFAVLLPQSSESVVRECIRRLRRAIERYNESSTGFGLSVSTGYAVEDGPSTDVNAVFKRADDAMYKEKLQQNHSSRNATIQALIKTLEERDRITEGHAGRLCNYAQQLGRSVGLSGERLNDLQLLARFHDLGKVGISDSILFKQSPLTEEEFEEMKRHCEIGHRIAMATSDLAPIAEYILKHHEHWNGQGYPLGLSGEDIPLECRILSIVDAFDSMTSARPYKEAHSREQALKELKRWAGIQFDPDLVDRFARIMHNDNGEGDKKGNT